MDSNITIIGGGNMGRAIALGLLVSETISPERITVANPSLDGLDELRIGGVVLETDNRKAAAKSDVVIIAVKPNVVPLVLKEIAGSLDKGSLLISVSAGIPLQSLEQMTSKGQAIVRVMPNVCAKVGESMSVWTKNANATDAQARTAQDILGSMGKQLELKNDAEIDIATAISGSGPAYLFYLAEVMIAKAQKLGLSEEAATTLVKQTLSGSANLLAQETRSPKELRDAVTSPGGTTEAAFKEFAARGLEAALEAGIAAAAQRAKELGQSNK